MMAVIFWTGITLAILAIVIQLVLWGIGFVRWVRRRMTARAMWKLADRWSKM